MCNGSRSHFYFSFDVRIRFGFNLCPPKVQVCIVVDSMKAAIVFRKNNGSLAFALELMLEHSKLFEIEAPHIAEGFIIDVMPSINVQLFFMNE